MTEKATVESIVEIVRGDFLSAGKQLFEPDESRLREAIRAIIEERDQAEESDRRHYAMFESSTRECEEVIVERDALAAQLSQKCGCIHANVSDGPHPELAAKDRMYATEVCWYHRFVYQELWRLEKK